MVEQITLGGEYCIESISDFIKIAYSLGEIGNARKAVYRGQAEDLPLIPKLFRLYNDHRATKFNDVDELDIDEMAELHKKEELLLEGFKRQAPPYLASEPDNILDWLAIGQHHGLATRLLDWAENPLTALFFAVENSYKKSYIEKNEKCAVLWALNADKLPELSHFSKLDEIDAFLRKREVRGGLYYPKHINPRLIAQQGCFTVHEINPDIYKVGLQERHEKAPIDFRLTKFFISPKAKRTIREQLDDLGINYLSIFPDLDGLSRKLNWLQLVPHEARFIGENDFDQYKCKEKEPTE